MCYSKRDLWKIPLLKNNLVSIINHLIFFFFDVLKCTGNLRTGFLIGHVLLVHCSLQIYRAAGFLDFFKCHSSN